MDHIIATQEIQIERKSFTIECRENERGRFMRIVEQSHGRRNMVIIPSTGFSDFTNAVAHVSTEATYPGPKQGTGIPNH